MATRTDLRQMVAEEAGVIAAGETLSAADNDYIERRIVSVLDTLNEEGLLPFDIDGTIPARYLLPTARVIAVHVAVGFGMPLDTLAPLADQGMKQLRRSKSKPHVGTPAQSTYY
ncbi:hypothetical protein IP90_00943 [Luteimonas cucumeris]|uniref:Uncharacterized protein n=1 Tax=Luteimonas cucumeris TaxID=985012 RepID=A0A562LB82_9GAMM|nr:hypothetical protein [Luteimonas cucumeris]TWI04805.1 hypothetical protein IP90_00943 [Luteimonas cucumeris]